MNKYVFEFIGTFFLVFTVGGISGGVFNPAVALGGSIMNMFAWSNIWLYLLAELLAAAAAFAFRFAHPGE